MQLDDVSEARLSLVHPKISVQIHTLADMLGTTDFDMRITQGLRSWSQQDALCHQIPKVTDVPGGYSWHNFGLAVDVAPLVDGIPDWNVSHPDWQRILALGTTLGFVEGSRWRTFPDNPHLQMTGRFPVEPDDEVRQLFKDGGIQAVWDESGLS